MKRFHVIQKFIKSEKFSTYLEIGVNAGSSFFPIRIKNKIGVDPKFEIPISQKIKWMFKNPFNFGAKYYQMTSDDFFKYNGSKFNWDVAFIDGLNTYEQVMKDFDNTFERLSPKGVIVLHDCNPISEVATHRSQYSEELEVNDLEGWRKQWSGDVWKAICNLRSFRDDLYVCVLDTDYGLGIVRRGKPENMLGMTHQEIDKMTYQLFTADKIRLLNLKPVSYLHELLKMRF